MALSFPARAVAESQADAALAEALKAQILRCWNPPFPPKGVSPVVVTINVRLDIDGKLVEPPTLQSKLDTDDPYIQAIVNSATRAVSICAPYKMPRDQFEVWKEVVIAFDPRSP